MLGVSAAVTESMTGKRMFRRNMTLEDEYNTMLTERECQQNCRIHSCGGLQYSWTNGQDLRASLFGMAKDIHRPTNMGKASRKSTSGISELLQAAEDHPPLQEDSDELKHGRVQLLFDDDLQERLKFLPSWKLSADKRSISKTFQATNFTEGIKIFNAVATLAEEYDHFPDLHIMENQEVTVVLTTQHIQGLSSLDIAMAERFDNIDLGTPRDSEDSLPMEEVQPPDTSQQRSVEAASKKSNKTPEKQRVTSSMERIREFEYSAEKGTPTLLRSLILVYAEAEPGGLASKEAARRMRKQSLPGLRETGKKAAEQVAKVIRRHPDFIACSGKNAGCFALRKSLLRDFQCGSFDPGEYADEKMMEATVLETYASSAAALELKSKRSSPTPKPHGFYLI